jgi:hypothetical protein
MYQHEKRPAAAQDALDGRHAYRLKQWPQIPERFRSVQVLRACSRMSLGPVTATWFLNTIGLEPALAAELMSEMIAQDCIERLDLGPRAAGQAAITRVPPPAVTRLRARLALRFPWKQAAVAAILCLGISAALDHQFGASPALIAHPNLPLLTG